MNAVQRGLSDFWRTFLTPASLGLGLGLFQLFEKWQEHLTRLLFPLDRCVSLILAKESLRTLGDRQKSCSFALHFN